jgi:hypothetical protein
LKDISIEIVSEFLKKGKIDLRSTHGKLCFPIIERIYKKMSIGIKFPSIKVDGDLIIDGHHRYLASLLVGCTLDIAPSIKTSATVVSEWNKVVLDVDDWDTDAKIRMLNEEDARYNGIKIDKIAELLK